MKRLRRASPHATEHEEQMTLLAWAGTVRLRDRPLADWLVMIPNEGGLAAAASGGKRHAYWQKLLKLGFRRGASDLFLAYPSNGSAGLWLEMKRGRKAFPSAVALSSAVKPHQAEFHLQMRSAGYGTAVAYGWGEARDLINIYLTKELPHAA